MQYRKLIAAGISVVVIAIPTWIQMEQSRMREIMSGEVQNMKERYEETQKQIDEIKTMSGEAILERLSDGEGRRAAHLKLFEYKPTPEESSMQRAVKRYQSESGKIMTNFDFDTLWLVTFLDMLFPENIVDLETIRSSRGKIAAALKASDAYEEFAMDSNEPLLNQIMEEERVNFVYRYVLRSALRTYHQEAKDALMKRIELQRRTLQAVDDFLQFLEGRHGTYQWDKSTNKISFETEEDIAKYKEFAQKLIDLSDERDALLQEELRRWNETIRRMDEKYSSPSS